MARSAGPVRKVSIVTVCLNARDTIRLTLESVARQTFPVEHVIIDGGSSDGTQDIVREYPVGHFVSEKDKGVYDAMDKGARAVTGDIAIFLNAGDTFFDDRTCEEVAAYFERTGADLVFGNLLPVYLRPGDTHDHDAFTPGRFLDLGYVVNRRQLYDESIHHQATFYRRWILQKCTYRCPAPEATGEYNLLLCAVMKHGARVKHVPRTVSRFVLGGISTGNFEKQWASYVRARDLLRRMYFPADPARIEVPDELEFRADPGALGPPPDPAAVAAAEAAARRAAWKQRIKRSFAFRVSERLALGFTMRVAGETQLRTEALLEAQTRRLFEDLSFVVQRSRAGQLDAEGLRAGLRPLAAGLQRGLGEQRRAQARLAARVDGVGARLDALDARLGTTGGVEAQLAALSGRLAAIERAMQDQVLVVKQQAEGLALLVKEQAAGLGLRVDEQAAGLGLRVDEQAAGLGLRLGEQAAGLAERIEDGTRRLQAAADRAQVGLATVHGRLPAAPDFAANGFKVYSQWDEDGLIQHLVRELQPPARAFVEIGVGDYTEANTRLLLEKDRWRGLVVDCSAPDVEAIRNGTSRWRDGLEAVCAMVDRDNIDAILRDHGFAGELGLLSIDVDGNDYWLWDAMRAADPTIVVCEYNGLFGSRAAVTVPYDPTFDRRAKHWSWLYAGASLRALERLARAKGYTLVGTSRGGNNAFFVRDDALARSGVRPAARPYTRPMFREARNPDGTLAYLDIADAVRLVADLEVLDVDSGRTVRIGELDIAHD